jgi:hypothetical protein
MVAGQSYAYREKRGTDQSMLKVNLLEKIGRKGKIRFDTGQHPGLDEYVETRQVVCAWGERAAVRRDEKRAVEFAEHANRTRDGALATTACAVLGSTGEPGAWVKGTGSSMSEAQLQRIIDRAGLKTEPAQRHRLAFRDRDGYVHLPLDAVVTLARAFAAAEPEIVVDYLDDTEEEYRIRGMQPGERFYRGHRRELSPSHAIARQWEGFEQKAKMLRKEIARLRTLVYRASRDLGEAGQERNAKALERALDGF